MTLPVAPCPRCGAPVVYGERACRQCAQPFDYGAAAVAIPDIHAVREALVSRGLPAPPAPMLDLDAILAAPSAAPSTTAASRAAPSQGAFVAPAVDDSMQGLIERTDYGDAGAIPVERVPDLIDSRLFGAMVPDVVPTQTIEGLEATHVEVSGDVPVDMETASLLDTGRFDGSRDAPTAVEDIPGFVDSTLFAAFSQGPVVTEPVPDIELASIPRERSKAAARDDDDGLLPCTDCGTPFIGTRCPSCGARRSASI